VENKRLLGRLLDQWEQTPNDVRSWLEEQHAALVAALDELYADVEKGIKNQD
jgi:hypothetical protein